MSPSPFLVNVADLRAHPGRSRRVVIETPVEYGIELASTDPEGDLVATLDLRSITGGLMVHGDITYPLRLTCYRCLAERSEVGTVRVRELIESVPDDDADYVLEGDDVDLEPVVRDQVTLSLPLLPLCREECRGLCAVCGADLNRGACSGHDDESDSPFASLRELLEP